MVPLMVSHALACFDVSSDDRAKLSLRRDVRSDSQQRLNYLFIPAAASDVTVGGDEDEQCVRREAAAWLAAGVY